MGYKKPTLREAKSEALKYLNILKNDGVNIRAAYLFGSFVQGKQHQHSDIDLLVSVRGFKNWIEAGGALHKRLFKVRSRYPLDVVGHVKSQLDEGIPLESEVLRKSIRLV